MRIDEDPTIEQKTDERDTEKCWDWRMKMDQKVKCRNHTQTQNESYMLWKQTQEAKHRKNKLSIDKEELKKGKPNT